MPPVSRISLPNEPRGFLSRASRDIKFLVMIQRLKPVSLPYPTCACSFPPHQLIPHDFRTSSSIYVPQLYDLC